MNLFIPYENHAKTIDHTKIKNKNTKKKGKFSKQFKRYNDHKRYNKRRTKKVNENRIFTHKITKGGRGIMNNIESVSLYSNHIYESFFFDVENNLVFNSYKNHPSYRIVKQILRGVIIRDEKVIEFLAISILSLSKSLYVHTSRSNEHGLHGGGNMSESVGEALINPERKIRPRFKRHIKEVIIHLLFLVLSCYTFYKLKMELNNHLESSVIETSNSRFDIDKYIQDSSKLVWSERSNIDTDFLANYVIKDEVVMSRYFHIDDILGHVFSFKHVEDEVKQRLSVIPEDDFELRLREDFKNIQSLLKSEQDRFKFRQFTSLFIPELNQLSYENLVGSSHNHFTKLEDYTLGMIKREKLIMNNTVSENMKESLYKIYDFVIIGYFLMAGSFLSASRLMYLIKNKNDGNRNAVENSEDDVVDSIDKVEREPKQLLPVVETKAESLREKNHDTVSRQQIIPYRKPFDPYQYMRTQKPMAKQNKPVRIKTQKDLNEEAYIASRMKSLQSRM